MTDAIDILVTARARIAKPENWGQGRRNQDRRFDTCCLAEAVEESCHWGEYEDDLQERLMALRAVYNAAGLDRGESIVGWNDQPRRRHFDVMAVLNLAIATLRL